MHKLAAGRTAGLPVGVGAIVLWSLTQLGCSSGKHGKDWLGADESTSSADTTGAASTRSGPEDFTSGDSTGSADRTMTTGRDTVFIPSTESTGASTTSSVSSTTSSETVTSDETSGTTQDEPTEEPLPAGKGFACGVQISRVSINQSVEIALSHGPELLPVTQERGHVWESRESLFRVYLDKRVPGTKQVKVTLEVLNGVTEMRRELELELNASSTEGSIDSTANFVVPDLMISSRTRYRVQVKQDEACIPGPWDRAKVPRRGFWELSARAAPDVDIQFVRVAFEGEEPIARLTAEFRAKLIETLRARYPIRWIRFNLRSSRRMILPMERTDVADPTLMMLDYVTAARDRAEDPLSKLHYIGLGNMGPKGAGIGEAPTEDEPGVCVVNSQADENKLIARIVAMVGRLHGLSPSDCSKGSSPAHPDKIGVWGFDAVRGAVLEPDRYYDISCGKKPDWIHHASYVKFAKRALNIAKR